MVYHNFNKILKLFFKIDNNKKFILSQNYIVKKKIVK